MKLTSYFINECRSLLNIFTTFSVYKQVGITDSWRIPQIMCNKTFIFQMYYQFVPLILQLNHMKKKNTTQMNI